MVAPITFFKKPLVYLSFLTIIIVSVSIYTRINFEPLYQRFGFYQGDIWYFHTFFGNQILNNFFFQIEYPVGYIVIQKVAAFLSLNILGNFSYESFMKANAFLIAISAITLVLSLNKMAKIFQKRIPAVFYLIFSPSFFIYSTINYDIFPTTLTVLSVVFLFSKKYALSFLLLALGAVIKIYPLFLLPLFLFYLHSKEKKLNHIIYFSLIFLAVVLFINIPFVVYNFDFWTYPFIYQLSNPERNDPTTISYFIFNFLGLSWLRGIFLPLMVTTSWAISYLFYRKKILDEKNFLFLAFLICFSSVFGNQVYTPQYTLWFLPFLALVQIPDIKIWWPFDLLNASTRFFYFKIKSDLSPILTYVWYLGVVYYLVLYILLIVHAKKTLSRKG